LPPEVTFMTETLHVLVAVAPLPPPPVMDNVGAEVKPLPGLMRPMDVIVPSVFGALTVPPPVAVKAALTPVLRLRAPVKLIVAPVLLARLMPVPDPLTAPL